MRQLLIAIAVAAALVASGCDRKPEKKDDHVAISGGGKITIQSEDGKANVEVTTNGEEASAELPDFVAVYPGGKVQSTIQGNGEGQAGGGIVYATTASPADVIAFYRKRAEAAGMAETMKMEAGGAHIFSATRKDSKQTIHVSATAGDDGTQVGVFWTNGG